MNVCGDQTHRPQDHLQQRTSILDNRMPTIHPEALDRYEDSCQDLLNEQATDKHLARHMRHRREYPTPILAIEFLPLYPALETN